MVRAALAGYGGSGGLAKDYKIPRRELDALAGLRELHQTLLRELRQRHMLGSGDRRPAVLELVVVEVARQRRTPTYLKFLESSFSFTDSPEF